MGSDGPSVHVRGVDPEACRAAVRRALMYRAKFNNGVVIDVVGYRRWGHNEGDEPAYTQPLMYERIRQTPTVRQRYAERLVAPGVVDAPPGRAQPQQFYQPPSARQQTLKTPPS